MKRLNIDRAGQKVELFLRLLRLSIKQKFKSSNVGQSGSIPNSASVKKNSCQPCKSYLMRKVDKRPISPVLYGYETERLFVESRASFQDDESRLYSFAWQAHTLWGFENHDV